MSDDKLWKVYSLYIRLRDANDEGYATCFTCGQVKPWKSMDAGHGIPRQYKATKYDERNVQSQCRKCNWLEAGAREKYKERVNQKYGVGTWEKLEVMSRTTCKRDQFEIDVMTKHYSELVKELRKQKGL